MFDCRKASIIDASVKVDFFTVRPSSRLRSEPSFWTRIRGSDRILLWFNPRHLEYPRMIAFIFRSAYMEDELLELEFGLQFQKIFEPVCSQWLTLCCHRSHTCAQARAWWVKS